MFRIVPGILFCAVLALVAASGCGDGAKDADVKLEKAAVDVIQGGSADVKVTAGKADKVEVPADAKGVTATAAADKVTVKADADAKEGDHTVTVKGAKGSATLKVTVKKKT